MEFRLLGPLEVGDGETSLELGGRKQRALLARLLLDANRAVSLEQLVEALWEEEIPETASKMVQLYVSRLRKVLPGGVLRTRPPGYLLEVGEHALDLQQFERLFAEGRAALAAGDVEAALERLQAALSLWRGPALAEFSEPFAPPERARLDELRLACLEERIEAELALQRHRDVIADLEALVGRHPLRERPRRQLMLALYRSGRHADALGVFRTFRRTLDEELGIEPSTELKELERRILRQDAELDAAVAAPAAELPSALTQPEVHFARSGDVNIAYQVVGDGPFDLVLVHGWVCTFQPGWEDALISRFYRRLASMGRLIMFDKRGTGLSDRLSVDRLPDLETRMDDVRAVMDAVGSERAVLAGISEGGPMSALFAATYPQRTVALVLMGTMARDMWAPDYPLGYTEKEWQTWRAETAHLEWGEPIARRWLKRTAPDAARDPERLRWYGTYVLRGASPSADLALSLMDKEIDVRHVLPTIRVPTLALYRADEVFREETRYMGERIPGARIVELPGDAHLPWEGDQETLLEEIERFLGGVEEEADLDRVLATVLFTDLVGSTAKAVELGDRAWRELLERHHALVATQLIRFRGREVDSAGDGVFAIFDGPARAVRCACSIVRSVHELGLEARAGLHTGEVELAQDKVSGIAVHIGARVAAQAAPGEVLVSHTVKDLVAGSGLEFESRSRVELKGVPGEWQLLAAKAA
ncbi:MAG: alpha/beta fold hydrolase [Gaiellaceae bacterium]